MKEVGPLIKMKDVRSNHSNMLVLQGKRKEKQLFYISQDKRVFFAAKKVDWTEHNVSQVQYLKAKKLFRYPSL